MESFRETVEWLYTQLPVYQRTGPGAHYKIDLDKTHRLMELLDHPEGAFPSIHVAGTNGKGSVSHMLASILQEAGYKVGLYTSPHLVDFRERVKINGELMPEEEVISFVNRYKTHFQSLQLSFFEMTVGLAFDTFRKHKVDVAVVEVGMGGRLDSTNVIIPEVSVITNIGLDHTAFLGTTIPEIAAEKGGIIKPNVPVVIGQKQSSTTPVFREIAKKNNSPIFFAEDEVFESLESDLKGYYQKHNIRTAVCAIRTQKKFSVTDENIENGLLNVVRNTRLAGRWQTLSENPYIICDTGHNEDGVKYILQQLSDTPHKKLHMVWGMVNDKDIRKVLSMLPKSAQYYFAKPSIPRGLDAKELADAAQEAHLVGAAYPSVMDAIEAAKSNFCEGDLIFVGGSTFVVADALS
ncbi:MAG: bifunctional folylpolyglutamate synthase/dihydrofolate synthase [Bacteroidetes bacterium]|nr:MAG: bifunctional folylpolyglutamate synthase/dihydrofolate synthase [Bacteroidota bacterium]